MKLAKIFRLTMLLTLLLMSCASSLNQYRSLRTRTLNFRKDGLGLDYVQNICKKKLVFFSKCRTVYDFYPFADVEKMKELANMNFKAKVY